MKKYKPDFKNCQDPVFAKAYYEALQTAFEQVKNNPFLKVFNETNKKKIKAFGAT